ncbi:MAG: Rrf2 family transcriptional regulator [Candidatus Eisenbacteria bacterium]
MLRISTKGRYASRVLMDLALNREKGFVLLKDIAERQGISVGYLEQIIGPLKASGLVKSNRGSHGGYRLSREPASVTLREVLTAEEGELSLVECAGTPAVCERSGFCATREVWKRISDELERSLESVTIQELADTHKKKLQRQQAPEPLTYSI